MPTRLLDVANLVLTVVGEDRAGLVAALAEVVTAHGGNWEHSQLAELAGTFAGIVLVSVPDERTDALRGALTGLDGLLQVRTQTGGDALALPARQELRVSVLGDDRPGIVLEISGVLSRHGVSIQAINSESREAPMAGGRLFEAQLQARLSDEVDLARLQSELEALAAELMVDISLD